MAAAVALLLAGCVQPDGRQFEVEPRETQLDGTGEWGVRLTLDEPFTYDHPGCGPELFALHVATPNGTIRLYDYGQEPMFGACVITEKTLPAGEHEEAFDWNGRTEGRKPDPHEGPRVPEGTYTLHATMRGTNMTAQATVHVSG